MYNLENKKKSLFIWQEKFFDYTGESKVFIFCRLSL